MWKCRLCGWSGEIPPDAVEIDVARSRGTRRGKLYKFGGVIHDLRKLPETNPPVVEQTESFQQLPQPPPVEQIQEVQPPEELPEIVVEVKPDEDSEQPMTAMAAAFNRLIKS
jgi:hypothetical protein